MNVITIAILGVICGADTWVDIERYGQAKFDWLAGILDLNNGIPSHDTFGRVFRWLDAEQFQARFMVWTRQVCRRTKGKLVAVNGKKLRRSRDGTHGRDGIWMVSAWVSENRMVLGQQQVDDKSNEITAIPELLAALDITGCIVTIDAMGSQTDIAERIVKAKADYILPVKDNQGILFEDMAVLRHMAINLLKHETSVKVGIAAKRKMAGWDNDYLLRVLCP
jgi:hypothetical protein